MNAEQRAKIDAEVLRCLEATYAADRPEARVAEHIERLKTDPRWTSEEIIELQTRVIAALAVRRGPLVPPPDPAPPLFSSAALRRLTTVGLLVLVILVIVLLAIFIGGNLSMQRQFRGLRELREESLKSLANPPVLPRVPPPAEPTPTPVPESTPSP